MDLRILECRRFIAPSSKFSIKRTVYDYEIDFHLIGDRIITINGTETLIQKGDISFRKPGQTVSSIGDYDCYILTLDFSGKKNCRSYSRNELTEVQPPCQDSIVSDIPRKVTPTAVNTLTTLFETLSGQVDFESEYAKDLARQILYTINADAIANRLSHQKQSESAEDVVYKYIHENFQNPITLSVLADYVHLDPAYLSRLFKRKFNMSPIEYVISLRLDYARSLVLHTDLTSTQIAAYCGYNNVSFFVSSYKKEYGFTPRCHRRHMRGESEFPFT